MNIIQFPKASAHIFLYYESIGIEVLNKIKLVYNGPIFLSLINNNCANDIFINLAKTLFPEIYISYIDNYGTDQYGFYTSFKHDKLDTSWILYCHDKHENKRTWLFNLINIFENINNSLLSNTSYGIISSSHHKMKQPSFEEILTILNDLPYEFRKNTVEHMHTLVWLYELQRIYLSKYGSGDKENKHPTFTAGNIFLIRRNIVEHAHSCVHDNFFNKNVYRSDGEVGHGLERFYYYVSKCMKYDNLFI